MKKEALLLEVKSLSKMFRIGEPGREVVAVKDIEFSVGAGEFLCIVGPSCCGKSTLLRVMAGLEPPSGGSVTYKGEPVEEPIAAASMMFQNFALFPWLTVAGNVALPLELSGVPEKDMRSAVMRHLTTVGLDGFENKYPKDLSNGAKQRVGLARSLATNPEIIFIDEPFGTLDAYTASILRKDLVKIWEKSDNIAIVMTTNSLTEAVELADRVIVLSATPGRVKGEVQVQMERPRDESSKKFIGFYRKALALLEKQRGGTESAVG